MQKDQIHHGARVHAKGADRLGSAGITGVWIGTVDHMDGDEFIKLKRTDSPDGRHHWIPLEWVERIEGENVYLKKTAEEVQKGMLDSNPLAA